MQEDYKFPVDNIFEARDVLEADFDIKKYPELIVDLDSVRQTDRFKNYKKNIKLNLGIDDTNKFNPKSRQPTKILFSGYIGSGKSVELWNINKELNHPDRFFTVYIDLEKEIEIEWFKFEDFFILLIISLIKALNEAKIDIEKDIRELESIIKDWKSEKVIEEEVKKSIGYNTSAEAGTNLSFLGLFISKFNFKLSYGSNSEFREKIRQMVTRDGNRLVARINTVLDEVREKLKNNDNLGNEIIFVIDGSEKISQHQYEKLFITDSYLFRKINSKMICTVPISSYFKIEYNNASTFYQNVLLPVVNVNNDNSKEKFKEIVARRIKINNFFEENVIDYFVKKSGGIVRQLLKLINFALLYKDKDKLGVNESKEIIEEYGRRMYERLSKEDLYLLKEIKKGEKVIPGEERHGKLIFGLFILKHNGHYEINPVLEHLLNDNR